MPQSSSLPSKEPRFGQIDPLSCEENLTAFCVGQKRVETCGPGIFCADGASAKTMGYDSTRKNGGDELASFRYRLFERAVRKSGAKERLSVSGSGRGAFLAQAKRRQRYDIPYEYLMEETAVHKTAVKDETLLVLTDPESSSGDAVLYLYGGAFLTRPREEDYKLAVKLVRETGCDVYFPFYPLVPEHSVYEAAALVIDVINMMTSRVPKEKCTILAFSSGANLACYAFMMAMHEGIEIRMPGRVILNSPLLRVPTAMEDVQRMAGKAEDDSVLPMVFLSENGLIGSMIEQEEPSHRYLADVLAYDLSGFPETDLYYGSKEIASIWMKDMKEKAYTEGFRLHTHLGEDMMHCWGLYDRYPEGLKTQEEYMQIVRRSRAGSLKLGKKSGGNLMAKKKRRRGVSIILVLLLAVLFGGLAAGWNYISLIRTKYEGTAHPYWSKMTFNQLSPSSLEYKVAEKVLNPETLASFAETEEVSTATAAAPEEVQQVSEEREDGIHIEHVSAGTYEGFMIVVPDPKDVSIVINPGYSSGAPGPELDWYVEHFHALAGINGGGFEDAGGHGDGSIPQGLVIQDGKIVHGNESTRSSIVGLDNKGKLVTSTLTGAEALSRGVVEAVTFGPTFIENGRVVYTSADAGTLNMLNPRTAVGQQEDGTILLLVIDGRGPTSFGAQYEDVIKVFQDYKAVNAGNLDGGNSSVMIYDGEYANYPVSMYNSRNLPSVVLVKGDK